MSLIRDIALLIWACLVVVTFIRSLIASTTLQFVSFEVQLVLLWCMWHIMFNKK